MDVPVHRSGDDHRAHREFERLREGFADQLEQWPDFIRPLPDRPRGVMPAVDVEETDSSFVLEVELPGVRQEDVDLRVDRGRVLITGERRERVRGGLLHHRSRTTGHFALALALPGPTDTAAVSASFEAGLLTVVVPKGERSRRRRIPIAVRP
jgi:HSP20 family protein